MGERDTNRRWIVLLNKAPKGPFTAVEIQELLDQGILRRNDLASVVEESSSKKGEWKLIWQYVEFDRRSGLEAEKAEEKNVAAERRKAAAVEELRQKAISELPPNWSDIRPEDLTPHSTSTSTQTSEIPLEEFEKTLGSETAFPMRMRLGFGAAITLAVAFYFMSTTKVEGPAAVATAPKAAPAKVETVQLPKRLPAQSRPAAATPAAPVAPAARVRSASEIPIEDTADADRGEVDPLDDEPRVASAKKRTVKRKQAKDQAAEDEEEGPVAEDRDEYGEDRAPADDNRDDPEDEPQAED